MKTCKTCGDTIGVYQRAYCSRDCAMDANRKRARARKREMREAGIKPSQFTKALRAEAMREVEAAEEALRVLRLEMEAQTPVRPRAHSLAAAEALAGQFQDHGADQAMLREHAMTGRARASRQATSPGQTMA